MDADRHGLFRIRPADDDGDLILLSQPAAKDDEFRRAEILQRHGGAGGDFEMLAAGMAAAKMGGVQAQAGGKCVHPARHIGGHHGGQKQRPARQFGGAADERIGIPPHRRGACAERVGQRRCLLERNAAQRNRDIALRFDAKAGGAGRGQQQAMAPLHGLRELVVNAGGHAIQRQHGEMPLSLPQQHGTAKTQFGDGTFHRDACGFLIEAQGMTRWHEPSRRSQTPSYSLLYQDRTPAR